MAPAAMGDFGSGSFRGPDDEHFESAHDGPVGAVGSEAVDEVDLVDAAAAPLSFDPVDMDSHDDFDLNGDGVVDHGDVHTALHGLHDFHAQEHADPHHPDPHAHTPDPARFFHH